MPVAVHTGAAEGCKQAIRCGARSLEHGYLIAEEALDMAENAGAFLVPTMQAIREDRAGLAKGTLADYTAAKFPRDAEQIQHSQHLIAASNVKIAYGTDCGTFPFSHGNLEFQAMVAAGINPARALRAATATAAELLGRQDIGVLEPGRVADIVATRSGRPRAARRVRCRCLSSFLTNCRSNARGRRAATWCSRIATVATCPDPSHRPGGFRPQ
jgi:imidazolonepropionase-like amidohydrolase